MPSSDRLRLPSLLPRLLIPILLAALVLAAGCQPLPHPFQPDDKQVSRSHLRTLVNNSLFIVRPLEGVPEPVGAAFAEALAAELQRQEVPATARQLGGRAVAIAPAIAAAPPEAGIGTLRIEYLLVEANGRARPVAADELPVEGAAFGAGDPALLASLAERGSRRLLETVFRRAQPAPAQAAAPQRPKAEFFLFDVSGAPGDGNRALARAMKRILAASGVPFAGEMTADAYILAGAVAMEDVSAERQRVFIDWTLFAPDGEEIGTVSVDNVVPRSSLDGSWGPVAEAATAGSAEGMLQLINAVLNSLPVPAG